MHAKLPWLLLCALAAIAAGAARSAAQEKVTLSSDALDVDVSLQAPQILAYRLKSTGGVILGSLGKGAPSAVVSRRGGQPTTVQWQNLAPAVKSTKDSVVFSCTAKIGNDQAATFDYAIRLSGNAVSIAMENVREADGFDLNEWLFPADPLIRVTGDLPGAKACVGDLGQSGRIAPAGASVPAASHFGLVFTEKAAAGMYSNSLYNQGDKPVHSLVGEGSTGLFANHHRYSYKDENYEPFWCKIGIVGDVNADQAIDWKDAACVIHDAIPQRVRLNQDCIKYMLNHGMDFESACQDVLRKFCNMADGQKQMALLSGWNGWGWDSEYPTWNQPGEEYGGREGLYKLHEGAHQYRAYTSMIHNFDDAYKNTRGWDDSIIARRSDGSLWNATWWSGGPSFIIGPYRFYKTGKMKEAIDGLIAQGEEHQIFSDVFTIIPWRGDEDRVNGADSVTNLVLGKFKLLDYLAQHDIYMNSEGFNYEMLGRYIGAHNGYNSGLTRDANSPPLAMFICQGLLAKKMGAGDEGRFRGADTETTQPFQPDNLYRWSMLISFYGDKPMRDFRVTPEGYLARYGDDVEVLWRNAGGAGGGGRGGPAGGGRGGARGTRGGRAGSQPATAAAGQAEMVVATGQPASQPATARGGRGGARAGGGRGGFGGGGGGGAVTVKLAGNLICDGPSVLLPKSDLKGNMWNVLRAFSSNGQPMRYPKPKNWADIGQLTVMALTFDHTPQIISGTQSFLDGPVGTAQEKLLHERQISTETRGTRMIVTVAPKSAGDQNLEGYVLADVGFEGDELVIRAPASQPIKLVYGKSLVQGELSFQPLPPRAPITYPLEEVIQRVGGDARPPWIRLKTRKTLPVEPGVTLAVGASAVWPTKEEATKHAANIVARKLAWNVRGSYVSSVARPAEQKAGATTDSLGYDNWQLGYDGAISLFSLEKINARPGVQWYWEQVKAGPNREIGWKAFVCVPLKNQDGKDVYVESVKMRLKECQNTLENNPGRNQRQLELNIKVYELILEAMKNFAPRQISLQV